MLQFIGKRVILFLLGQWGLPIQFRRAYCSSRFGTYDPCLTRLLGFSLHFAITFATSKSNASSVFNLPLKQNLNYTFALNIPDGSSDLYFHLSGPTDYSWVAVGTGSRMENSLMIVLYSSADGKSRSCLPDILLVRKCMD